MVIGLAGVWAVTTTQTALALNDEPAKLTMLAYKIAMVVSRIFV